MGHQDGHAAPTSPCPVTPGSWVECSPGGRPECCGGCQEPEGRAGPALLAHQPSPASCSRSGSPLQPGTSTPTASRAPWRSQATPCFPAQPGLHGGLWPGPGTPCAAWRTIHGRCLQASYPHAAPPAAADSTEEQQFAFPGSSGPGSSDSWGLCCGCCRLAGLGMESWGFGSWWVKTTLRCLRDPGSQGTLGL